MIRETIYILLPVYNRKETTRKFIRCLKKQTHSDYHLILIDDGSTDGTDLMAKSELAEKCTIIKGKGNWWHGGSIQQGYLWLKKNRVPLDSLILMANDDIIFNERLLENAINIMSAKQKTVLISQAYDDGTKCLIEKGVHIDWKRLRDDRLPEDNRIETFSTWAVFLRYDDFVNVGGFRPKLFPHYFADYEFGIRAFRKRYAFITAPEISVWVKPVAASNTMFRSGSFIEYVKQYFSKKNCSNPYYHSLFVLIACPARWKIQNILIIWFRSIWIISRAFMHYLMFKRKGKQLI